MIDYKDIINRVLEMGEIDVRNIQDDILLISTDEEYTTAMNVGPGIMVDIRPNKNILIVSCNFWSTELMIKLAEEYLIELDKSSLPEHKELYILDIYETNTGIGSHLSQSNLGYVEQLMYRCKELTVNTTVSLVNADINPRRTASFRNVGQFDNYYSYPFSILDRTKTRLKSFKEENATTDYRSSPSKHFICMNANPIVKRIDLVNYLHKHKVIDTCHLSWLGVGYNDDLVLDEKPDDKNSQFDYTKRLILDYEPEHLRTNGNYESVPSFHYLSDSLIDIGIETCSEPIDGIKFITEKTWKPYLFGKVGFQFNYAGYYSDLEAFGFQLYDEIFDYTFDKIENNKIRFKEYCKEIKRISEISIEELTENIISIEKQILSNRHHVWNYKFPIPTVLKEYPNLGIGLND